MSDESLEGLLPEYINGTLSPKEMARIDAALLLDTDLAQELAFLKSLKNTIKEDEVVSPGDWGWQRLQRDIRKTQQIDESRGTSDNRPSEKANHWKKFAIAASFLLVLQSAYFVGQQFSSDVGIQLLSNEEILNTIDVQFKSNVSEQQMRQLITELHGSIVSGPSALGIYTLQFDDSPSALSALQASELIDYVEANR